MTEREYRLKEFQKLKRFICKRYPGAHTVQMSDGTTNYYKVLDGNLKSVVSPELMLPPAQTVREAWEHAKYVHWFQNMIKRSNNAFDDTKQFDQLTKNKKHRE